VAGVAPQYEGRLVDRLPPARPAASRVVLLPGSEQRRAAAHAQVASFLVVIPVAAAECALGAVQARHPVLHVGQLRTPFGVGLLDARQPLGAGFVGGLGGRHDEQHSWRLDAQSGGSAAYASIPGCSSYGRWRTFSSRATSS